MMLSASDCRQLLGENNPLFAFAYVPLPDRLEQLAEIAEDEPGDWQYRHTSSGYDRPILYSYLKYTFKRVLEQFEKRTLVFDSTGHRAAFDTGLMTPHFEPVYALFQPNANHEAKQNWFLQKFCAESDRDLRQFENLPEMVTYIDNPSSLVFDFRKSFVYNVEHIVDDNFDRFPASVKSMPKHLLRNVVESSANDSFKRARRNYKVGIPQFYRPAGGEGRVQLMLPLCLQQKTVADLALTFDIGDHDYRASTILTLDMAYNNARILARPDRDWLDP
jgi:hypothetical protein